MWEQIKKIFSGEEELEITEEYAQILAEFEEGKNLFITGKAGSGKSRLIEHIRRKTKKTVVVLAPTGLAALSIRGQTIHSFFKLPPRMLTPETMNKVRVDPSLFRSVDALVIDEASMVRADVLDAVDRILRKHGKDRNRPFGGLQIILVGDVYQLPPVVNSEEAEVFRSLYAIPYFFGASAYEQAGFELRTLTKIFRQKDDEFINILGRIRSGDVEEGHLEKLNLRVGKWAELEKPVVLAATNRVVNEINLRELAKLGGREKVYVAEFEGEYVHEDRTLPVEAELRLKKGARVVILKNGAGWANGSTGVVAELGEASITVRLDENGNKVEIGREEWENVKYEVDTKTRKVEEKVYGKMRQIPVRLAWAVTIHKSQGMSFDQVFIDLSSAPFAHGQTYVALSRCRTLAGLALSRPIYPNDIIVDPEVVDFAKRK